MILIRPCVRRLCVCSVFRWEGLGWSTLRWNSNVHREASLTVTMGAEPADPPVGPRGYTVPSTTPVVQITYVYGCSPVDGAKSGLNALILAAGDEEDNKELADPDAYRIVLQG